MTNSPLVRLTEMFMSVLAVYYEHNNKHIKVYCGENSQFFIIVFKGESIQSYHCTLRG
jgi:hypothetical protein